MKQWLIAALLAASPASWAADVFVEGHGGLLGLGADVGLDFGRTRVRAQLNQYDASETDSYDGVDYKVSLDLDSVGVLVDFAPFNGAFYLTAGMFDNGTEVSGVSQFSSVQVGNTTLTNEQVYTDVTFDDMAPYAGVGWRFLNGKDKAGLGVSVDVGAYMNGSPDVEVTTSDANFNQNNQDDIAQEEKNIEDDIDQADILPVVKLGLSWYF